MKNCQLTVNSMYWLAFGFVDEDNSPTNVITPKDEH
jgi:hypothetical protein